MLEIEEISILLLQCISYHENKTRVDPDLVTDCTQNKGKHEETTI